MINITNLTLKELITDRPDLVQAIKNGEDKGTTSSCVEKDEKKRVKKWTEERRDIDGLLVSKRLDKTSYYETDEIDTIVQQVYNSNSLVSEQEIKHFKDGRKPEITESKAKKL